MGRLGAEGEEGPGGTLLDRGDDDAKDQANAESG